MKNQTGIKNLSNTLIALDIETAAKEGMPKDQALDPHRNIITKIAVYAPDKSLVVNSIEEIPNLIGRDIVTHGGKFDFKTLISKGALFTSDNLVHDTLAMAAVFPHKIPDSYLAQYEERRVIINKELGSTVHRNAGKHSLKTLAPYFLGVDPFWEVADHANDEYALKDAEYTYRLAHFFATEMEPEHWEFYLKLQSWNRMLLEAELRGVMLDMDVLASHEEQAKKNQEEAFSTLQTEWASHFKAYKEMNAVILEREYSEKCEKALTKLKNPTAEKAESTSKRYLKLLMQAQEKLEDFNLGSPTQLKWLFKERLGVDITTFSGDEESTGKAVLERLAGEGVEGVTTFLKWRKNQKLTTAFFPTYREMLYKGRIHTNYRVEGTRTGRLSSSDPNLQQISKDILDIVRATPEHKLVYRDVSAIEPRLIAYETEDRELCKIFLDGSDFHSFNVRSMLGIQEEDSVIKTQYKKERDLLKEVGLALMYGAGPRRIQECAAKRGFKWSFGDCKKKYQNFAYTYQTVWEYKEALEQSIQNGDIVTNVLGRPLSYDVDRLHMQSLNTKIQSGGSDILLESVHRAIQMAEDRGLSFHPILFIHDSVTVETLDKDAKAVYDLIGEAISSWELQTIWGRIPLLSEGDIFDNLPAKG